MGEPMRAVRFSGQMALDGALPLIRGARRRRPSTIVQGRTPSVVMAGPAVFFAPSLQTVASSGWRSTASALAVGARQAGTMSLALQRHRNLAVAVAQAAAPSFGMTTFSIGFATILSNCAFASRLPPGLSDRIDLQFHIRHLPEKAKLLRYPKRKICSVTGISVSARFTWC
ncbi:hypothetical protein [Burkholderia ubonensis]|uniref:hypothetical protein n=1 Tax=Burkholderia ubonensis TaxID=101571 RepID=UPI0012F8498B|nr:hypothetical protein [Burkholderia ubonensis]